MDPILPITVIPVKYGITGIGNNRTNGIGTMSYMDYLDARLILAKNLRALFMYAREHNDAGPHNAVALKQETERLYPGGGVSNSALSRYMSGEVAANLDHLAKIAQAYRLQVWQLMYPNLEPANPPVLLQTKAETELYEILQAGMKLLQREAHEPAGPAPPGKDRGHSPHRPPTSKVKAGRHKV